jgi:ubiquinone/menaquinone biosynthesis C-methylase UbiE
MKSDKTSWGGVASWYDEYLKDEDSYQAKVIWPNLKRILDIGAMGGKGKKTEKNTSSILDLACGQGHFSFLCAEEGADVTGLDIAPELIEVANDRLKKSPAEIQKRLRFDIAPANDLQGITSKTYDTVLCVLALQNIKELDQTIGECMRVLRKGGRFVFVINHPSFRIPQYSDWHYDIDKKIQSRLVSKYMEEATIAIDMNPGSSSQSNRFAKKQITYSFHRPLQLFTKLLSRHGFFVKRIEEWCSHKKTEAGPRKAAEDKARNEIPMFMCIEAHVLG